jgi:4-hydroxy-tetrahydrodipicolinate reductase
MKILLIGYGKMGKTIESLAPSLGHQISGIIDVENAHEFPDLSKESDVAIEFTHPGAAFHNISTCIRSQLPVVSGTTGWLERFKDIISLVDEKESAFFYASNFSIGVNLFFEMSRRMASMMARQGAYNIRITETHHTEKKDAPSGTAITLAEQVLENTAHLERWSLLPEDGDRLLPIKSIREGKVFGIHELAYTSNIDTISLRHEAFSREGFARGAITAAEWIIGKKGVFGMKDLLEL